jgi:transcription elongation GreA/GreB family factor
MPDLVNPKPALLQHCIALKEQNRIDLISAMNEAQLAANEYGAPRDRYDSFRAQQMRKRDMLAQQLAVAEEELRHLRQIKPETISLQVEPGALVEVNGQKLYIITGIGKIELNNETYYIISPVVPLVVAMKGLKVDDSFTFNGKTSKIKSIF